MASQIYHLPSAQNIRICRRARVLTDYGPRLPPIEAAELDDVEVDNGGMAKRSNPVHMIWDEAPRALSFLIDKGGFAGPELTADGVAYHRPALHVCMEYWSWKNEHGFTYDAGAGQQRRDRGARSIRHVVRSVWPRSGS